ncbi:MAG: hemolysin III family protein [Candidatus Krumholzibacteriia bacterium]
MRPSRPTYSLGEEIANAVTHGVGALLAVAGLVLVVLRAVHHGDTWSLVAGAVYGTTLILLYTASTLYHALPHPRAKGVLRVIDHTAIYLLIAGTYTPFTLITLRGPWGWSVLGTVWGLAVAGIVFEILLRGHRWRRLSLVFYVGLGWIAVVAARPLVGALPPQGLGLLLLGGLLYTGGAVFYAWRRLPWNHAIWHVFVLGGSLAHFLCVYRYVVA